jgi:hypothetical protein
MVESAFVEYSEWIEDGKGTYPGSFLSDKNSHDDHNEKGKQPCVRAELNEEVEVSLPYDSSDPLQ